MNEKKIQVIIDSTTDIAKSLKDRVEIVPLIVSFGEKEYLDGVELSRDEFYEKLEEGDVLPKTSQASPAVFEEYYKKAEEKGMEALVITVASKLSGTYQSACIAAQDHPGVRVVDSKNVAVAAGILAEYAIRRIDEGAGLSELAEELEQKRDDICLVAMLDTLEYLMKGGRISKTAAFAGGVLNIKPVVTVRDGEILVLGKARGIKKANNFLIEEVKKNGIDYDMPVLLGYSGRSDELLKNYIKESEDLWKGKIGHLEYSQICSVVGTHAGPGVVGVAFFKAKESDS